MGAGASNTVCRISIQKSFTFIINEQDTTTVRPGVKRVTIPEIKDEDFREGPYLLKFSRPKKLGNLQVRASGAGWRCNVPSGTEIEYSRPLKDLCIGFEHFDRLFVNQQPPTDIYRDPKSTWSFAVTIKLAKKTGTTPTLPA